MLYVALLLLAAVAAETPKGEAPKPRTAPLQEIHLVKLQLAAANFREAQRAMQDAQQENDAVRAAVCKAAGFAKCTIDGQNKLVLEQKGDDK